MRMFFRLLPGSTCCRSLSLVATSARWEAERSEARSHVAFLPAVAKGSAAGRDQLGPRSRSSPRRAAVWKKPKA